MSAESAPARLAPEAVRDVMSVYTDINGCVHLHHLGRGCGEPCSECASAPCQDVEPAGARRDEEEPEQVSDAAAPDSRDDDERDADPDERQRKKDEPGAVGP